MDFEGMLLRKVHLDTDVLIEVMDICVDAVRRCFPRQGRELAGQEIRELVHKLVLNGINQQHVFENPLRTNQLIVFARLWGAPCWFVLGEEEDGTRKVVTVRMHKDKNFGEEFKEVEDE